MTPLSTCDDLNRTTPRILVVEDDKYLNDELKQLLSDSAYQVDQCHDGEEALSKALCESYHLVLLDLMLPVRDGLSMLNLLRKTDATPVMIVSARHAEQERIQGLSAGADDYMAKPFNKEELLLRVDAILRRTMRPKAVEDQVLSHQNLTLNKAQQQVEINQQSVTVTPTEMGLLYMLIQNRGEVLSKAYLYQTVFHRQYSQYDRSLDMHISKLRRKLTAAGWDGSCLQTVHGKGYCLQ